jgi:hypothetical protein
MIAGALTPLVADVAEMATILPRPNMADFLYLPTT